jgi:hypothetical protein
MGAGAGWVLSQTVAALAYYTPENNPILYPEAERWLGLGAVGARGCDPAKRCRVHWQREANAQCLRGLVARQDEHWPRVRRSCTAHALRC